MTGQKSNSYLLDTSAVLTLIEDEPGADRVEELLRNRVVLLPFVVGLETYYITCQERGTDEADRRLFLLRHLPAQWLNAVDDAVLVTAGRFKANYRLSLADCLVAAFASETGAVLVHKDPEYDSLDTLRQERLPYKDMQRSGR
ncbi:MAG: PIN domain-containing protein [Dehalococcoidia bacterium]|nr:PIN domain-containing protein [Dehalococcoidia bacterium]